MEEDGIELNDYFRVILKRRILIIVGTLACIVVGVVMSRGVPVKYYSDMVIKIGKRVEFQLPSTAASISSCIVSLVPVEELAKSIPIEYGPIIREHKGVGINVEVIGGTAMVKIIVSGTNSETEKILKKVVNMVIDSHLRVTESYVSFYEKFIERQLENISEVRNKTVQEASVSKKIDIYADKEIGADESPEGIDILALMVIKDIETRREDTAKGSIHDNIFLCQSVIDILKENRTKQIGGVNSTVIKPKKMRNIILAGFIGLMMSLFLVFFIAWLENTIEAKKEKVDSP